MTKIKRRKGQTIALHRNLKIGQQKHHLKPRINTNTLEESCFTSGTRRVSLVTNQMISHAYES
jgi:hypothetical protein